jgi:hypothetical protein
MLCMFLDDLWACLLHFTLAQRIRVPCLEAVLLCRCWIANALCAVRLEYHGLERAGCGRHIDRTMDDHTKQRQRLTMKAGR